MTISSTLPTSASSQASATDRAAEAVLAKATAKLAADRKGGATADVLNSDQQAVTKATKADQKSEAALKSGGSNISLTA